MHVFWLLLLLGVAVLGGLIAWLGDNVGRQIGRKHIRIFGLRPKTTGLLFAIGSGVLVALATVGTVSLLARSTVDNALKAPEMRLELEALKTNLKKINLESEQSRRNLQKMRDQSILAQQEFDSVRSELEQRQQELSATAELNGRLSARISGLETERNALNSQIQSKTGELVKLGEASAQRTNTLKREISALEAQRSESSSQIQRLSTQRTQLQNRIETLGKERSTLEGKVASAQTATQAALLRQSNLETTVASLESGRDKLEAQQLQLETQRNQLQGERNQLQGERNQLVASVTKLENQAQQLESQSQQLENQSQVLRNERTKLQSDIAELNQTRTSLEASVNRLERQNNSLTQQLNSAEAQLREAQEALAEATSGNFIFRQGELVSQLLLESNSPEALREQLQKWIKQAAQVAQIRGATRSKAVVVKPSADLEPYISEAQRSKGSDLILMRTSRSVTQTGIELPVTLEVRPNEALYTSGQPVRLRELVIGSAKATASLRLMIENLLRDSERELLERGVPRENLPSPLVSAAEVSAFLSQLESNSGSVWVAVAARRDLTPAGPVQVYLSLMR